MEVTKVPPSLGEEVEYVDLTPVLACDFAHDAEIISVGHLPMPVDQALPRVVDYEAFAPELCPTASVRERQHGGSPGPLSTP